MGYTTDFSGQFELNTPLDEDTHTFLTKLASTRRMKRDRDALKKETGIDFGIDGEFYVESNETGMEGYKSGSVIDHNRPPETQPSLWLQWVPNEAGTAIEWDGNEKFYSYVEWIEYLIKKVLQPKGYFLNGAVQWRGEDFGDTGTIVIKNNKVTCHSGKLLTMPKPKAKAKKPAKAAKASDKVEVLLVSHKHKGATYFSSDSLCDFLKMCKVASDGSGKAIDLAIQELQRIAERS